MLLRHRLDQGALRRVLDRVVDRQHHGVAVGRVHLLVVGGLHGQLHGVRAHAGALLLAAQLLVVEQLDAGQAGVVARVVQRHVSHHVGREVRAGVLPLALLHEVDRAHRNVLAELQLHVLERGHLLRGQLAREGHLRGAGQALVDGVVGDVHHARDGVGERGGVLVLDVAGDHIGTLHEAAAGQLVIIAVEYLAPARHDLHRLLVLGVGKRHIVLVLDHLQVVQTRNQAGQGNDGDQEQEMDSDTVRFTEHTSTLHATDADLRQEGKGAVGRFFL